MVSSQEAKDFLQKLQLTIRYLGIADADMEKGQMRCEPTVNLEINKEGKLFFTPLVEIKNINSFRFVQKAIDYEIKRQAEEFEKTGEIKSDANKTTRGWNEKNSSTFLQRRKEEASDYRYFPEPDIPPIKWIKEDIENIKSQMVENPESKKLRFVASYEIADNTADVLIQKKEVADYFESVAKLLEQAGRPIGEITQAANMIVNKKVDAGKLSPQELANIIMSREKEMMFLSEDDMKQIANDLINNNSQIAQDYKNGKTGGLMFLVGQAMKNSPGKINPQEFRNILEKLLS
jgi:aspartyl-tRNA(Asn)/glutamyl-tRNA(Gln) amidotransferase subunit B